LAGHCWSIARSHDILSLYPRRTNAMNADGDSWSSIRLPRHSPASQRLA
jgi:hypothetical protein